MLRLFPEYEAAIRIIWDFTARCIISLDQLTYTYPTEELEDGLNAKNVGKADLQGVAKRDPEELPKCRD